MHPIYLAIIVIAGIVFIYFPPTNKPKKLPPPPTRSYREVTLMIEQNIKACKTFADINNCFRMVMDFRSEFPYHRMTQYDSDAFITMLATKEYLIGSLSNVDELIESL